MHHEPAANEDLGKYAAGDDDQVQQTGDPRVKKRPLFCGPIRFYGCAHVRCSVGEK
jgi:hypothetical protein